MKHDPPKTTWSISNTLHCVSSLETGCCQDLGIWVALAPLLEEDVVNFVRRYKKHNVSGLLFDLLGRLLG